MNGIVTLEEVKQGLRIDEDYEDAIVEALIQPATNAIKNILRRSWENCYETFSEDDWSDIKAAIIMFVGTMRKNPEATVEREIKVNLAFRLLLRPHIKLTKE